MTLFFVVYLFLTVLMMMNKLYCLVNHQSDYRIKKFIQLTKAKTTDPKSQTMGLVHAAMLRDFYGGIGTTIFVFLVEFSWFLVGLFSFMWPFFLVLFAINYGVNFFEKTLLRTTTTFFATKIVYLFLYSWFFFHFLDHYLKF